MTTIANYVQETLDPKKYEIRLLQLQPGHNDADIEVKLIVTTLDSAVEYEALSYAWGDPQLTSPIRILSSSDLSTFTFEATHSLVSALRSIRSPDVVRLLWIDAICINQNDNEEKGHQVRLMGEIYARAMRVIVYVGEEENQCNEVMELISQNPQDLDETWKLLADGRWKLAWRALTTFVQRPYFFRCWVVQEVALAKEIILVCGTLTCEWDSFILVNRVLFGETYVFSINRQLSEEHDSDEHGNPFRNWDVSNRHFSGWYLGTTKIMGLQVLRYSCGKVSLKSNLVIMNGRAVTDPRDGVYSALGMAKNVNSNIWKVDYEQDPIDTFFDATENIVRETGSLDIICHNKWSEQHAHGCSWIPRFIGRFEDCGCDAFMKDSLTGCEILLPGEGTLSHIMTDIPAYSASWTLKAEAVFDKSSRKLTAKGVVIDKVTKVLDVAETYRGGLTIPRQWKEEAMSFGIATDDHLSEEGRTARNVNIFWRVLVANRDQVELGYGEYDLDLLDDFNDIFEQVEGLLEDYREPAPEYFGEECKTWMEGDMTVPNGSTSYFLRKVSVYIRSKRYIIMEKTMGLGPEDSKPGDVVAILFGCSVPVILRPSKKEVGAYHFVGEAYVHGVMDGEVEDKLNDDAYQVECLSLI